MWFSAVIAITGFCLIVAAPQQPGSLESLISEVYENPNRKPTESVTGADLDTLIDSVFNRSTNTGSSGLGGGSGVTLGTQNTPAPKPDNCECVPYYQCRDGNILENGVGIIDIRSGFTENDRSQGAFGPCEEYLDVCCKPPDTTKPEDKILPRPTERRGCGVRHPEGVGFRITGDMDNEAQFGEFPWMVAVLKEEPIGTNGQNMKIYQCGGALIHRRAVLTAAHCVNGKQPSELRVRAGEWDTQTKNEVFPYQDRSVETVVVHEKFHSGALYNDYAILILTEPVEYAENVDVVCLPDQSTVISDSNCYASGWGKDMFGKEGHYQVILKRVPLPLVPHESCQDSLRQTRLGKYFTLHESFICAGGQAGKDTCKGDGGSPLVCPLKSDPTRYVQAGIVAWGIGCGENDTPGVYANVAYGREWIDQQMRYYNLDTSEYQYQP